MNNQTKEKIFVYEGQLKKETNPFQTEILMIPHGFGTLFELEPLISNASFNEK